MNEREDDEDIATRGEHGVGMALATVTAPSSQV